MLCSKSHTIGILTNLTIGRRLVEYDDSSLNNVNILLDTSKLDSHKQENFQKGPIYSLQKAKTQTPYKCYFCISHPLSSYNARNCKKKTGKQRQRQKQARTRTSWSSETKSQPSRSHLSLAATIPSRVCLSCSLSSTAHLAID